MVIVLNYTTQFYLTLTSPSAALWTHSPARLCTAHHFCRAAVLLSPCGYSPTATSRSTSGPRPCRDAQTLVAPIRHDPSGRGGDPLDESEPGLYATSATGQSSSNPLRILHLHDSKKVPILISEVDVKI